VLEIDSETLGEIVDATTDIPKEDEATISDALTTVETDTFDGNLLALLPSGDISTLLAEDFNTLNKTMKVTDTYMEFGYIANADTSEILSAYLTGDLTPSALIDSYILNNQSASYSGALRAFVDGVSSEGTINLNIDYGQQTLSGDITVTQGNWQADITSGTVSPYGFSSSNIVSGDGSDVENISGNIDGKYYGPNAENIGGTFQLNSDSSSVNGVFGGAKQ
jgi:hypothetical protein